MTRLLTICATILACACAPAFAQAPSGGPAGSTGQCKDMSYTSNAAKKGACAGHKGVKEWFGAARAKEPSASSNAATPIAKAAPASASAPAPGGGPGQVWVNTKSNVYHCSGTKYYGTTKEGKYMTQAEAKAAGAHADHGKACS